MNTESNLPPVRTDEATLGRKVIAVLDMQAIHMPISSMLQELQMIVERLTFGSESTKGGLTNADVMMLVGGDISAEMLRFVEWLEERKLINLLVGKNGRQFLSFCDRYYKSVREVKVTLPIVASSEFRHRIIGQLRAMYPEPARIIFETSPSIMAGCIIHDGQKKTDMSLSKRSPELVDAFIQTIQPRPQPVDVTPIRQAIEVKQPELQGVTDGR